MYKLLATDMDGTLLNARRGVSRANVRALSRAARQGVHVTICTGRYYGSARVYGWALGIDPYIVSANGAIAHDWEGRILYATPMATEEVAAVLRILRHYRLPFHLYMPNGLVTEQALPLSASKRRLTAADLRQPGAVLLRSVSRLYNRPRIVPDAEVYSRENGSGLKFYCEEGEPGSLAGALAAIRASGLNLEISSSGDDNFELTARGVHKASGLGRLAAYLGVDRAEVVAVGDHLNDLEMLAWAGLGVAVANAVPAAKAAARYVAPVTNDQGAVAHVVEHFILGTR